MSGVSAGDTLEQRILYALDRLLHALELEALAGDHFGVAAEPGRFNRMFGGQMLAQALVAAAATVEGKAAMSLHAYFVEGGAPGESVEITVDRVRDGRSMSTRRSTLAQGDRTLLTAIASFHANPEGPELGDPMPEVPDPDAWPTLQDWVRDAHDSFWVEYPPPLDIRMGESLSFLGEPSDAPVRSHWMRLPRTIGDDALVHAALLAYASDYFLMDMAFRSHPARSGTTSLQGTSLDHAIWFHRPVRFDEWHLHTQDLIALSGHRALARGLIHDAGGHLVATVMQEILVRPGTSERERIR